MVPGVLHFGVFGFNPRAILCALLTSAEKGGHRNRGLADPWPQLLAYSAEAHTKTMLCKIYDRAFFIAPDREEDVMVIEALV